MKKYLLIVCLIGLGNILLSGNPSTNNESSATKLITGKVIDKVSGEEIAGAEIKIADKTYYSDLNGNFSISLPMAKPTAIVNFISYNTTEINIDLLSYAPVTIELSSK